MANGSYFRYDDDDNNKKKNTGILTIIIREMVKLNTHILMYCMKDNLENWLNLRHTLGSMFSSLEVQYFQVRLHDNDNEVV